MNLEKMGKDIEKKIRNTLLKDKKSTKAHKKPRCFVVFNVPVDIYPEFVTIIQSYAQHKKKLILSAISKDPIEIKVQKKMRSVINNVLKSKECSDDDVIHAIEKFTGQTLEDEEDKIRYIG